MSCRILVIINSIFTFISIGQFHKAGPICLVPDDVQKYAESMRQQYREQPIIPSDWPPRVGQSFFGRLSLVEGQDSFVQKDSAWCLLRGNVDKILAMTGHKEVTVEDIFQPTDSSLSLRVVIDGPPGIGKTTICRKLLNMWSTGPFLQQHYDLVLYCPLRNSKIAAATTLTDLFEYQSYEVPMVSDWLHKQNGKGLLIIFDGWDELNTQLRQSSFVANIIYRKHLKDCSVIVTSRSYASSSLLMKLDTLSRHVHVIGFSKEEVATVIIRALQKDPYLAQEIIDKNIDKYSKKVKTYFIKTTDSSKESKLAVKLINDLKVRSDVQSLCYVPLVCSMVILAYRKEEGNLPASLTQLYENFILQTIRRHSMKRSIDPFTLGSLLSLPSQFTKALQEISLIAYTNLKKTRITFSLYELREQSLHEAVKEEYLGLMTTFVDLDEVKYQFLHLTIQEFLAAWWIAKHEEKTEEVFKTHFNDDHFRMCLKFVAGFTQLKHESYHQYFNEQKFDLQMKRKPLFGFEKCHLMCFYQNPEIRWSHFHSHENYHVRSDDFDKLPIFLLQLLYESQNPKLCQVLANSMKTYSLVNTEVVLQYFDMMCLSFFLDNSSTTWNHLHLGSIKDPLTLTFFIDGLSTSHNSKNSRCERLDVALSIDSDATLHQVLKTSLFHHISECYIALYHAIPCSLHKVLLQFLRLPRLKILHLLISHSRLQQFEQYFNFPDYTELEKCIELNSTLQELKIDSRNNFGETAGKSIIKGVTRNKNITTLSLYVDNFLTFTSLAHGDGMYVLVKKLLKDNTTLHCLSLNVSDCFIQSYAAQNIEVNTPLTALEIGSFNTELVGSLLPFIKGLHCLILPQPYPPSLIFPNHHHSLRTLTLPLDIASNALELFTFLQTNTTLIALRVEIKDEKVYTSTVGTSLQNMLQCNVTLKYLEISTNWYYAVDLDGYEFSELAIPSSFLSNIAVGLKVNSSLTQLSASVPLVFHGPPHSFFHVISEKENLTELQLNFTQDQSYSNDIYAFGDKEEKMTSLFYERALPTVSSILLSHATLRLIRIECWTLIPGVFLPSWRKEVQEFYEILISHPSLKYIEIFVMIDDGNPRFIMRDIFNELKKALIESHGQTDPSKSLPIIKFGSLIQ